MPEEDTLSLFIPNNKQSLSVLLSENHRFVIAYAKLYGTAQGTTSDTM